MLDCRCFFISFGSMLYKFTLDGRSMFRISEAGDSIMIVSSLAITAPALEESNLGSRIVFISYRDALVHSRLFSLSVGRLSARLLYGSIGNRLMGIFIDFFSPLKESERGGSVFKQYSDVCRYRVDRQGRFTLASSDKLPLEKLERM